MAPSLNDPSQAGGGQLLSHSELDDKVSEQMPDSNTIQEQQSNKPNCNTQECSEIADQMKQINSQNLGILSNVASDSGINLKKAIAAMQAYNQSTEIAEGIKKSQIEEAYIKSYNNLNDAQYNFKQNLEKYCALQSHQTSQVCVGELQNQLSVYRKELDDYITQGTDLSNNIAVLINTYQSEELAYKRMLELSTERAAELSVEEGKIDEFITEVQTNQRESLYDKEEHNLYDEIKIVMIFLFYMVLLAYLFSSNFFSGERWKKFAYIILLILYLAFPFYISYLLIFFVSIYNSILKYFDLYKANITANSIQNSGLPPITGADLKI
jgi:hypothetical protein